MPPSTTTSTWATPRRVRITSGLTAAELKLINKRRAALASPLEPLDEPPYEITVSELGDVVARRQARRAAGPEAAA